MNGWKKGSRIVVTLLEGLSTAFLCTFAGAALILVLVKSAGGFDPRILIEAPPSLEAVGMGRLFIDWLTSLLSPGFGHSWMGRPLIELIGLTMRSIGLVMWTLLFSMLAALLWSVSALRRGEDGDRPHWVDVFMLSPTVLWASLILVFITATIRIIGHLGPVVDGVAGAVGEGLVTGRTQMLFESYERGSLRNVAAVIALSLGSGTLHDVKRGLTRELSRILESDYILAARVNGLSVVGRILRNAASPFLAKAVAKLPVLLGEVIIVEYLFGLEGIGVELYRHIEYRDAPAVMTVTAVLVFFTLVMRTLTSFLQTLLLPAPVEDAQ